MIEPMLPIALSPETVALVYSTATGEIIDECFNWETAQNFAAAADQYVVAVADDVFTNYAGEKIVSMTKENIQEMCDRERELFIDCFGG